MGLISKLGAGLATLVMLTGGCAEAKVPETSVQDSQPRIITMDYNAATNFAVMGLCRMANVGSLPGVRDCHLVKADFSQATEGAVLEVTAVADAPGYDTSLPVFTPSGDAVYAVRRRSEDWAELGFRSPLEVVRIDLSTREIMVIAAGGGPGTLSVVDVLVDDTGLEQLVMFENRSVNDRGLPTGGRVVLMTVDQDGLVEGSRRDLNDLIPGGDFEISVNGLGFVKGAIERVNGRVTPVGFMAFTIETMVAGRPAILSTTEAAVARVTGCAAAVCMAPAARRAHAAVAAISARPTYDTSRIRGVRTTVDNVVAAFPDRPAVFFPDDVDPFGSYRLDYDLAGGAVATPRGVQSDPGRVPFTLMGGDAIPFMPVISGYLDLAGYAAGKL